MKPVTKNHHFINLRMPSKENFDEIAHDYKLRKSSIQQLRLTLTEAFEYYEVFRRAAVSKSSHKAIRRRAERTSSKLTKIIEIFEEKDAPKELQAFEAFPQLGTLFSTSAIADFIGEEELEKEYNLLSADYPSFAEIFEKPGTSHASRDRFQGIARQAIMQDQGVNLLVHILKQLRHPFDLWLNIASRKKNGRPINAPREVLLYHLIRDAHLILADSFTDERMKEFCSSVTGHCNLDDAGFSDAFDEIKKKYRLDFFWAQLPKMQPMHRDHLTGIGSDTVDDPEVSFTSAKPRPKK